MKKKTIAIVCAVLAIAAVGGGLLWKFLSANGSGNADNVVYVNKVSSLLNLGTGNGLENRYAGVVESQNTWKVEKSMDKVVRDIMVEVGQEVQVGTPLFTYDTDKFNSDLEQAQLDLERINNEMSSMNSNISQLYKDKKSAPKDQQASLTLQIQEAELDLKRKEYEGKSKQSEIDKLKENIINATVISEINGVVKSINKDDDTNGGYMGDGSDNSFITVLATGDFRIKGKINEQNMNQGSVMEGQMVVVHSRVDEEQTWTGTVTKIDRENAESNNNNYYYSSDSMTQSNSYPFYVALDSTAGLMLGQHVYIEPDLGEGAAEKTGIWLPEYFINDVSTNPFVWADNGKGKLEKRSVSLGTYDENSMEYQITDGLTEDDAITFPEDGLEEGMATVISTDGSMGQSNPAGTEDMIDDGTGDGMEVEPVYGGEEMPENGTIDGMQDGMQDMPEEGAADGTDAGASQSGESGNEVE